MATLTPTFEDFLPAWVARQRWYRGKRAGAPALRRVSSIRWQDPFGEVGIDDHLLVDESGPEPVVYQVPLTYRAEAVPFLEHALVATAEHSELGTRYIYDATHDPVFADVLLREMYAEHEVPAAHARRLAPEGPVPALASSRVLTGEQSNTSIIVDMHGEDLPVIIKLFRVLAEGDNPDVSVQTAVSRGGSRQVPDPVGSIEGRWVAPGGGEAHGHLAFAQEFLPGTEDAWRRALVAAGADRDFTESARSLGAATAAVHAVLRDAFGTRPAADRRSTLVAQMRTRAEQAFRDAPELSAYREPVLGVYAELESSDLPTCSGSTATTTSVRCSTPPTAAGCCWTSRASRCARSPSAPSPTSRCATWRACCAPSTTPPPPPLPRGRGTAARGPPPPASPSSTATPPVPGRTAARSSLRCWPRWSSTRRSTRSATRRRTGPSGSPSRSLRCAGSSASRPRTGATAVPPPCPPHPRLRRPRRPPPPTRPPAQLQQAPPPSPPTVRRRRPP
ncbi:maltokinase N-terminal cap-like domain-containing protein [Serinicoccus sp. CUA-874]|uniref:maltokinase N-terminal cap-like domain-containing protein n=1 Tax=Serinicoccus sp. CUA-874 TaxID=1517939 RepID=UPI0009F9F895|nr:hypothetical protein [Serinicoccus sp. CUA-874]